MRERKGRWMRWAGAAGAALLVASLPAAAPAGGVTTSDGTLLSVWVVRSRSVMGTPAASSIAYSASGPGGTVVGTVGPTGDATPDVSPRLALDPSSGAAALVWSRFEGVYYKISYARYEAGAWVDIHDLTFGTGDDLEPRLATSDAGSFLFWVSARRYLYAPVDLALGHLLAPPRALRLDGLHPAGPGTLRGGSDAPIVWGNKKKGSIWEPGNQTLEGGQDVPVVNGGSNHASLWGVGSQGGCGAIVLVAPLSNGLLGAYSFSNGTTALVGRAPIPASLPAGYADAVAAAYLNGCN